MAFQSNGLFLRGKVLEFLQFRGKRRVYPWNKQSNRYNRFFKRKDVVISAHRYGIDAMGAMAQGLFASLLIGTIIKTLGQQLGLAFLVTAGGYAAAVAGPAMAASHRLRAARAAAGAVQPDCRGRRCQ